MIHSGDSRAEAATFSPAVNEFMINFFVDLLVVVVVCFVSMGPQEDLLLAIAVSLTFAIVFVVMAASEKRFNGLPPL